MSMVAHQFGYVDFVVVVFQAGELDINRNKYSIFQIRHLQIDEHEDIRINRRSYALTIYFFAQRLS